MSEHVTDAPRFARGEDASRRHQPTGNSRLLIVVNHAPYFVSHRLPIAVAAQRAGFEVHVATPPAEPAVTTIREVGGCQVHPLPLDRSATGALGEWRSLRALRRLYRDIKPAIVHHVTVKPVLYGSLARRATGGGPVVNAVPGLGYVFLARGLRASLRRLLVELLYRIALSGHETKAIFQNPDDLEQFVAHGLIRRERAVLIRGSGVDLAEFAFAEELEGDPLVILPARMLRDKGVMEFVEAARLVRATLPNVRFALVGGCDTNRSAIDEARLRAWHAEGMVEWWGQRADMPHVMRQAHIVCLPSYREGVPKALIEAAATGRAIVTTDVPGCREVVAAGENGLLVPPRDSAALAAALTTLLRDPVLRRRMGRTGRARAEREFSIESVVRQTLDVYASFTQTAETR
jgi:glycosyltransferase involved in cell wall biosynthesis